MMWRIAYDTGRSLIGGKTRRLTVRQSAGGKVTAAKIGKALRYARAVMAMKGEHRVVLAFNRIPE